MHNHVTRWLHGTKACDTVVTDMWCSNQNMLMLMVEQMAANDNCDELWYTDINMNYDIHTLIWIMIYRHLNYDIHTFELWYTYINMNYDIMIYIHLYELWYYDIHTLILFMILWYTDINMNYDIHILISSLIGRCTANQCNTFNIKHRCKSCVVIITTTHIITPQKGMRTQIQITNGTLITSFEVKDIYWLIIFICNIAVSLLSEIYALLRLYHRKVVILTIKREAMLHTGWNVIMRQDGMKFRWKHKLGIWHSHGVKLSICMC